MYVIDGQQRKWSSGYVIQFEWVLMKKYLKSFLDQPLFVCLSSIRIWTSLQNNTFNNSNAKIYEKNVRNKKIRWNRVANKVENIVKYINNLPSSGKQNDICVSLIKVLRGFS